MAEETFRTIEGFEDYQISNLGRVVSNKNGKSRFLKPQQDAVGYLHVRLYKEDNSLGSYGDNRGKRPRLYKVHRLVAETFIPRENHEQHFHVNHINGDKTDNVVENLEWLSHADNIRHSWETGLRVNAAWKAAPKRYKPLKVTTPTGEVLYYKARKYALMDLGVISNIITKNLKEDHPIKKGKWKGYRFEHLNELPIGEFYTKILDIESKLLEYKKIQDYFRNKNRERREKQRKNKNYDSSR